jgi:hypothetical protein
MNAVQSPNLSRGHPPRWRDKIGVLLRLLGLVAAPLAWFSALLVMYGVASVTCRMKEARAGQEMAYAGSSWMWLVFFVTLVIAILGCVTAIRNWHKVRTEKTGAAFQPIEQDGGRRHFFAKCALLASVGFLAGFLFLLNNLVMAPLCGK